MGRGHRRPDEARRTTGHDMRSVKRQDFRLADSVQVLSSGAQHYRPTLWRAVARVPANPRPGRSGASVGLVSRSRQNAAGADGDNHQRAGSRGVLGREGQECGSPSVRPSTPASWHAPAVISHVVTQGDLLGMGTGVARRARVAPGAPEGLAARTGEGGGIEERRGSSPDPSPFTGGPPAPACGVRRVRARWQRWRRTCSTISRERQPVIRMRSVSWPPSASQRCAKACRNRCGCSPGIPASSPRRSSSWRRPESVSAPFRPSQRLRQAGHRVPGSRAKVAPERVGGLGSEWHCSFASPLAENQGDIGVEVQVIEAAARPVRPPGCRCRAATGRSPCRAG